MKFDHFKLINIPIVTYENNFWGGSGWIVPYLFVLVWLLKQFSVILLTISTTLLGQQPQMTQLVQVAQLLQMTQSAQMTELLQMTQSVPVT